MGASTVWGIVNTSFHLWGGDLFASEEIARAELRAFFKDRATEDKFELREIRLHHAVTGDYAGMGWKPNHSTVKLSRWTV